MNNLSKSIIKNVIWYCLLITGCASAQSDMGYINFKNCSNSNATIVYYPTETHALHENLPLKAIGKPLAFNLAPGEQTSKRTTGVLRFYPNDRTEYYVKDTNQTGEQKIDLSNINLSQDNQIYITIKPKTERWYTKLTHQATGSLKGEIVDYDKFQECK